MWVLIAVATAGAPSVSIGAHGAHLATATKADIEKLMAQNVQLMKAIEKGGALVARPS